MLWFVCILLIKFVIFLSNLTASSDMVPLPSFSERLTVTRVQTSPFGSIHLSFRPHYFQVKLLLVKYQVSFGHLPCPYTLSTGGQGGGGLRARPSGGFKPPNSTLSGNLPPLGFLTLSASDIVPLLISWKSHFSAFAGSALQYKLEQYKREQTAANELSSVVRFRRQPDLVRNGLLPMVRSNHYKYSWLPL